MRVIETIMYFIFKDLVDARYDDPMTLYDDADNMIVMAKSLVFKGNDDNDADDNVSGGFSIHTS